MGFLVHFGIATDGMGSAFTTDQGYGNLITRLSSLEFWDIWVIFEGFVHLAMYIGSDQKVRNN